MLSTFAKIGLHYRQAFRTTVGTRLFHSEILTVFDQMIYSNYPTKSITAPATIEDFKAYLPEVIHTIASSHEEIADIKLKERIGKLLNYILSNGKLRRGLTMVNAYKSLEYPENLTAENVHLANILGWCVELLLNGLLVTDDIMDRADMRRGLPCWHKLEGVGLVAVKDTFFLLHSIPFVVQKYFSNHRAYIPILQLVQDVTLVTSMGQALDGMQLLDGKPQFNAFTAERYNSIVKYKTACPAVYFPVVAAMHFSKKYTPELIKQTEKILYLLGHIFQSQDDFADAFYDSRVTGKTSCSDIREGKCTWLVVKALELATPEQQKILEQNYGKCDEGCIKTVRNLYEELEIAKAFGDYNNQKLAELDDLIKQISTSLPAEMFTAIEKQFCIKRSFD